jgi:hypothetical protein
MSPISRLYHGSKLIYEAPALTDKRPDAQRLTQATTAFQVGDRVELVQNSNIRRDAVISSASLIGVNLRGNRGTITEGPLAGANNTTWYRITFDRTVHNGWVISENLQRLATTAVNERTPSYFTNGQTVNIFRRANLRQTGALTGTLIRVVAANTSATIAEGPSRDTQGNIWYRLTFTGGAAGGWMASDNFMVTAGAPGTPIAPIGSSGPYTRPYGPSAEWNIPISQAVSRGAHPHESYIRNVLWTGFQSPGWVNFFDRDYTYPVYQSSQATTTARVSASAGNMNGSQIPWNPNWVIPGGTDQQIIILDEQNGWEYNAWQCRYSASTGVLTASRFSRVTASTDGSGGPANYRTKTNGFRPSRGCGIQYLAMLIRPQEIAQGRIEHALSFVFRRSGYRYYANPATKGERFPGNESDMGIPQGTRFWLDVSDAEIDAHIASWPSSVPQTTRRSMRIIFRAMREYGMIGTDQGGGNHIQFEHDASADWRPHGLTPSVSAGGREYPRDAIDFLLSNSSRIRVVRPPDGVMYYAEGGGRTPLVLETPIIAGSTSVGSTINVSRAGSLWGQHPVTISRQWRRNGTSTGQTGTSYTVQSGDRGATITVAYTATSPSGSNTTVSNGVFIP